MTTFFLDFNDEIYFIESSTYNITTKSFKIGTEKLETWEKATFSCSPGLQISHSSNSLQEPSSHEKCEHKPNDLNIWHPNDWTPTETTLNQPGDKKTHLRDDIRCKWTPLSV